MIHGPLTLSKYSVVHSFTHRCARPSHPERAPGQVSYRGSRRVKRSAEEEDAMTIHVSGRVRLLFDRHELRVDGEPPISVPAFRCRWCGFTVVADTPDDLPDHGCTGPQPAPAYRSAPTPPLSHGP